MVRNKSNIINAPESKSVHSAGCAGHLELYSAEEKFGFCFTIEVLFYLQKIFGAYFAYHFLKCLAFLRERFLNYFQLIG